MTYVKLILFIVAILISVLGGKKLKINAGLIAIGFAFIFGVTITGLGVNGVVNLFSARLFVNMFLVTFFFGYATANGTMLSITKYLFKNFKGAPWLLPLLFFAIPFLMAFAGASTDSIILFLTPIAFAFIIEAKLPPVLASILLWATCAGSWAPWLTNYATFSSWFGESIGMEAAEAGFTKLFVVACVINISFMLISYIVLGGWKVKTSMEILGDEKIEITKEQKKTMYIILAVIAVLIIMVCGMAMLMGEAGNLGVTETISALLESGSLPASAIIPFIAAVCGFLSLFVSGSVITPLIIALAPALVSYGVSGAAIIVASQMGMIATSISPYSMGGAICITGCPEKYSSKVGNQQLMLAIMMGVIVTLLAVFGVFN